MATIRAFVERHPVLSYFALVFTIGWGCILILAGGPGGIPTTQERFMMLMPWVMLLWFAGPSLAGILMIGLVHGREGFRKRAYALSSFLPKIVWGSPFYGDVCYASTWGSTTPI